MPLSRLIGIDARSYLPFQMAEVVLPLTAILSFALLYVLHYVLPLLLLYVTL